MDKMLAFSILSASPADISAGGAGARWTRLSWRTGADADHAAAAVAASQKQQRDEEKEKQRSCSHDRSGGSKGGGAAAAFLPRFAPEFDGIDCFETIVTH